MPITDARKRAIMKWREKNFDKYWEYHLEFKRQHYQENKEKYALKNALYRQAKKEYDYNYISKIFRRILI
jgi:hypothetical protein